MANIPFCEKCGKALEISEFMDIKIGKCSCGFKKFIYEEIGFSQNIVQKQEGKGVVDEKDQSEGFPNLCKKCGHNLCDIHDLGAPYGDESNVYLFKCRKCGYVERQADGTGNG